MFGYTGLPASFESTQRRHPHAPEAPADHASYVGPGKPETYPLANLARNCIEDGVKEIKLHFPRCIKQGGGRLWAWPVVVALLLGETDWSTTLSKHSVDQLFNLSLDDYAKRPHPYAVFRNDDNGTWQILR